MANFLLFLFLQALAISASPFPPEQCPPCDLQKFRECMMRLGNSDVSAIVDRGSNSIRYNQLNHQWNLRKHNDPAAYFLPKTTADVQAAVRCARESGLRVIPKCGGHSYESFSFGTPGHCEIIIDFRLMNQVQVNQRRKTAIVGPGALLGELYAKLWDYGLGLAMGDCVTVGIGGYALGGGTSRLSHLFGLAADNVLELEVVDVLGNAHTVNPRQNQDLYWAMRGVGSGFIGIVTSFTFKLFPASELEITLVTLYFDLENAVHVVKAYQKWITYSIANQPYVHSYIHVGDPLEALVYSGVGIKLYLTHVYHHSEQPERNTTFLEKSIEIFSPFRTMETDVFTSYWEYARKIGYANVDTNLTQSEIDWTELRNYNLVQNYHKRKSFFVSQEFNDGILEKMGEWVEKIPTSNIWFGLWTDGGKTAEVAANATAYVHRNTWYTFLLTYEGSNSQEDINQGMDYIQSFFKAMNVIDNGGTYQNYVDLELNPNQLKRYYKSNLKRLIKTKRIWDKNNYFQNPQSLATSEMETVV